MLRHQRSQLLQIGVAVLMMVLLAQLGTWVGSQTGPAAVTPQNNTPMMASVAGAPADQGKGQAVDAPPFEVGKDAMHDVSPPLRDIPPVPYDKPSSIREMTEPGGEGSGAAPLPDVSDPVVQNNFGNQIDAPSPSKNFEGITNRNGVYPPDTNGDVGPNNYVQIVNLSFQVFNKSGGSLYGPVNSNTIWSGFGGSCQTRNDGDPIVLYNSMADRWLVSQFTAASPYGQCVAISTSPDPTGSYYRYFFQFSTSTFYDYPHLGVWPDGYYMGANRFTGNTYNGGAAIVFNRANMLQGLSATFQSFNLSSSYGTPFPSDLDGPTPPPTGAPNYFMSRGTNVLDLFKFHVDWTTPSNSTFTGPTALSTAAYNVLCSTTRNCVQQPGTSVRLDGLGDRLMFRVAYRNFGDHESIVTNHSVNVSGGLAGVRWYEVRNPGGSPSIYQQGTYSPDNTNRWMGSVAMDGQGNMAMVYSASSSSVYPGIRYTGRLATDPLGQMSQGETTLIAGSGSQTGTASRWGDYSMMTIDPSDDCTFWMTTEYIQTTGTASWQTRIGAFKFPGCGGTPPTPTNTPVVAPTNTPTRTPTGLPTNTPTRTPTNTPTNTPGTGATNTPTRTPTITRTPTRTLTPTRTPTSALPTNTPTSTPTPGSGGCSNIIANGGFESGSTSWVESSSGGYELVVNNRPHTGSLGVWEGGYNNATESIYQTVTIPSNATSADLSFWWYMTSSEGTGTAYDYMYAEVRNTSGTLLGTLQTLSNKSTRNSWVQSSGLSLLAWKGQTVRVQFRTTTNSSLQTSFYIDDVALNSCN